MSRKIENFKFLQNDTKLFKYQDWVYKIKVLYEDQIDIVPKFAQNEANDDIDNVLRAVLYILERNLELRKIETKHFYVNVKIKPWKAAQNIGFKRNGITIKSYPDMIVLKLKVKPSVIERTKLDSQFGKTVSVSSMGSTELEKLKQNALHSNARVVLNRITAKTNLSKNQRHNEESYYQSTNSIKHLSKKNEKLMCSDSDGDQIRHKNLKRDKLKRIEESNADIDEIPVQRDTRKRKVMPCLSDNAKNVSESKVPRKQTIGATEVVNGQRSQNFQASPITRHKAGKKRNIPITTHRNTDFRSSNHEIALPPLTVRNSDEAEGERLQCLRKRRNFPLSNQSKYNSEVDTTSQPYKSRQKDRHVVEKEELDEDMKLQQLAKSSPNVKNDQERRRSSGIWNIVETILTPVKRIFS